MVKLGDFGACHLLSGNQSVMSTFRKIGTPRYMAPEIFQFQPCGKSADLWSLGCLLYEMVALSPAVGRILIGCMLQTLVGTELLCVALVHWFPCQFQYGDDTVMIDKIKSAEPLTMPRHIPTSLTERFSPLIHGLLRVDPRWVINTNVNEIIGNCIRLIICSIICDRQRMTLEQLSESPRCSGIDGMHGSEKID